MFNFNLLMEKKFVCMGSGQYIFDVIIVRKYPNGFVVGKKNEYVEETITEDAAGTCGNVMCMLQHLGWTAQPQVKLLDNEEGKLFKESLESFGCDTRYVKLDPEGGFYRLTCTHRKDNKTGEYKLSRRGSGPEGSIYPKVKPLRIKGVDEVTPFLASIDKVPDVYFFDTFDAGPRVIAENLRKRGSLIYFEAEKMDKLSTFMNSAKVADIVKFSNENVPDASVCDTFTDKLCIQTLGSEGLRFKLRDGAWIKVPPMPVENVVDWEGCGDTTTAVFINELGKLGLPKIADLTEDQVRRALEKACEKAAVCTQYYGSKGWVYAEMKSKH